MLGVSAVALYSIIVEPIGVTALHRSEVSHINRIESAIFGRDDLTGICSIAYNINAVSVLVVMVESVDAEIVKPNFPVTVEMEEIVVSKEYGNKLFVMIITSGIVAVGASLIDGEVTVYKYDLCSVGVYLVKLCIEPSQRFIGQLIVLIIPNKVGVGRKTCKSNNNIRKKSNEITVSCNLSFWT